MHHIAKASIAILTLSCFLAPATWAGWDEGVAAFKGGDYRQASEVFAEYIKQSPTTPQAHYMLGLSLLQQKRLLESLGPLGEASRLAPQDVTYRLALAQAQHRAHRADQALATLAAQELAKLPTEHKDTFDALMARSASESKEVESALAVLHKTLKSHRQSASLWRALANIESQRGGKAKALDALGEAYEISGDAAVGQQAATIARDLAQNSEGDVKLGWYAREAKIALRLVSKDPTAKNMLRVGEAQMGAQDLEAAAEWFAKAAVKDVKSPWPHFYLASCALADEQGNAALAHLEAASQRAPDSELQKGILRAKGSAYRQIKDFDRAAQFYGQAGDGDKVKEMENLASIQDNNAQWDIEKKRCAEKQESVRQLMVDNEEFRGTAAWDDLEAERARVHAECRTYFDESA